MARSIGVYRGADIVLDVSTSGQPFVVAYPAVDMCEIFYFSASPRPRRWFWPRTERQRDVEGAIRDAMRWVDGLAFRGTFTEETVAKAKAVLLNG